MLATTLHKMRVFDHMHRQQDSLSLSLPLMPPLRDASGMCFCKLLPQRHCQKVDVRVPVAALALQCPLMLAAPASAPASPGSQPMGMEHDLVFSWLINDFVAVT